MIDDSAKITNANGQTYTASTAPVIINTGAAGYGAQENQKASSGNAAMVAATSDNTDYFPYEVEAGAVGIYQNEDGTYSGTIGSGILKFQMDYADGWTWFDSDGNVLSDENVSQMTTEEKAQAFLEGRYAKGESGQNAGPGRCGNLK